MSQNKPRQKEKKEPQELHGPDKAPQTNKAGVDLPTRSLVGDAPPTPKPASPPEIERRVSFYKTQAIGMPLFLILPLLALFKVFDTTPSTTQAQGPELAVEVRYPAKLRHRTFQPLEITVRNTSGRDIAKAEVKLDRSYLERFQDIRFDPQIDEIDENSVVFELTDLKAGEVRRISGEYQADDVGRHRAQVEAASEGGAPTTATFSTFVFP